MAATRDISLRVRITKAELAAMRKLAVAEERTVSQLAWLAIREYLERHKNGRAT